jgi:hypothetical protein
MQQTRKLIDLNKLLMVANLLVAAALLFVFCREDVNEFVDQETHLLAILLCLQTQVALFIERKRRDPFVILMAFETIFYYSLRIFTLSTYPFSDVFSRYPYDASDSNYALIFMLVANAFLYAGFFVQKVGPERAIDTANRRVTAPGRVAWLLAFAIAFTYFSGSYWTEDNIPRVFSFVSQLLSTTVIVLMTVSYLVLFRRSLSRNMVLTLAALIVADMVVHTLVGSRSAILAVAQDFMMAALATAGCIRIRRSYILLGLASLPLMVVVLIGTFAISTFNRSNKDPGTSFNFGQALALANDSSSVLLAGPGLEVVLPPIFARTGFFDFAAEIIAHREQYSSLLNASSYAKSIVDNILTPGFDLYDAPKISNGLQFIYLDLGVPSKLEVPDQYHSDQLGIYGEYYALFGYWCLPLLFVMALLLKRIYLAVSSPNPFYLLMKRIVVLFIFVELLRSFGIDWIISEAIPLIGAIFLYAFLFASRAAPPLRVVP